MFGMTTEVATVATVAVVVTMAGWLLGGVEGREPVLHRVGGGKYTWTTNVNFTDWSIHEHFYVGDWLYFGFDKRIYNVLQVNKTSYDSCNENDFVFNVTRGGRDVFNLTQAKPYYFLSGRGFCFQGMKVAIFVEDSPPISSPRISNHSSSIQPLKPLSSLSVLITLAFTKIVLLN
ncbi:lamin-like protein [Cucurbita pepo subsp. pepo]|uniref:lamin-like protein n=1 Tax=Cucurbita pepo subsp. pepo TaxID=3664 RepID=UPI000C9D608D|nr:lamin-like protein [Cucurbita pepo subsp. pepo]